MWENARNQLERNLNVETFYVENVFVSNFDEAVNMLAENNVTVIVSTAHAFANVAERESLRNKNIQFLSFGGGRTLGNLAAFKPLLYQPAHVCGLAAVYNSDASSIGIVADNAMYNSAGVINAYILGAKIARENLATYVNYVSSHDEAKIRQAIDDLVRKGNDVIMLYLNTDYGIRYCEQIGVKVIAYSSTLAQTAPNTYITGFNFNVNSYLTEQVRFIQNGIFIPAVTVGEMVTGHVHMIEFSTNEDVVEAGTRDLAGRLFENVRNHDRVFSGEIKDNNGTVQVEHGVTLTYKEVLEIRNWLEFSVGGRAGAGGRDISFVEQRTDIPFVPLVVRGGWGGGESPHPTPTLAETDESGEIVSEPTSIEETEETTTTEKTEATTEATIEATIEATTEATEATESTEPTESEATSRSILAQ
jgi:basic membrane lipoprotein Med (substrate-binding protein (PBP1-ABC) superfamily)